MSAGNLHYGVQEPVDISALEALRQLQRPGSSDGIERIVTSFLQETQTRLEALRLACARANPTALEHAAHALRGISGTVGANEMHDLAMRLEQIGREGHTAGAADLVIELESAFTRARPILNRLRDAL